MQVKAKLVLYLIILNKRSLSYEIISEHPDRYEECSAIIDSTTDLDTQIDNLYSQYIDLNPEYVRFINLKPYVINNELVVPFYTIIPYNSYEFKNCYRLPCDKYVQIIPDLRKILNII